ncbi:cytochrome P450 4V2-like isoform X2 [Maniola hyperantus]|uniref:cytochrome P450 4V2-like isoform X2 n=1 Tax=Aphantopus hyperantus TaxID=2795564 RepID=UPI0037493A5D
MMWAVALILVFLSCGILAWRRRNRNKDEPPPLPGALPLIGHIHLLLGNSSQLWNTAKKVCYSSLNAGGVIISVYIGPRTTYFVTDPEDCLTVTNTCLEKDGFYNFGKPWFGDGLITADVQTWKVHRKLLNPAFNQSILDGFMDVLNEQARRLVKNLEVEVDKGPFDHFAYILLNVLETTCLTVMKVDFSDESLLNCEYVHAAEDMFKYLIERIQKPWLYSDVVFNWSFLKRKQDECLKILHNMSNTVLEKRKAEYLNNKLNKESTKGPKFRPFMDHLLELAVEKGAFNDREIREHVDTILFGGHDTSASVLMYTMLLVGSYPEVQEKIFEELHDVFGDEDRDVTKQDLSQLVYLEAVLKEAIRIYPIAPFIIRHLDQDVKLRNCTLSKGRTCFLSIYGVHRHPMWGPDVEEFKPERWLDSETLPKCPTAFAGFGMGRRSCIGKTYAMMSLKITLAQALAHVFRRYRVSGNHLLMTTKMDVLLKPVSGHHVTIEMRQNNQ